MAKSNIRPKFLLGVLDELITKKNELEVTWSTSKIGGLPDWIVPGIPTPSCRSCTQDLALVVQIYCPLDGSPYHRTIYIFGCINRNCWNISESWTAIRCQKLSDSSICLNADTRKCSLSEAWLENDDDWDEDNGNEEIYQDVYHDDVVNNQDTLRWGNTSATTPGNLFGEILDTDGNNVINMVSAHAGQNQNVILSDDDVCRHNTEALKFLDLNESGVGAVEGAVGLDPALEASAEVESPDEGSVVVESPVSPGPDIIATLLSEPKPLPKKLKPVLRSWFLGVVDEPFVDIHSQLLDHERELLVAYQKKDGLNVNELYSHNLGNTGELQFPGEMYEHSFPKHGDKTFHKLLARLRRCPQQLLRYSRDQDSYPMFSGPTSVEMLDPGICSRCGEPRVFELQLLPSLIEYLCIDELDETAVEFGIIVLYTCQASCWQEGDLYCEERLVVQPDPDSSLFSKVAMCRPK